MKHWLTRLFTFAIVGALGFGLFHYRDLIISWTTRQDPSSSIKSKKRLGETRKGEITITVTAAGSVYSAKSTAISPPYDGYVKKVFVKIGDQVKTGDPLLSIAESTIARRNEIFPLRAPFKGTVVEVNANQGEQVKVNSSGYDGSGLIRIEDFSSFYVSAELPELDYVKVKKSLAAKIRVSAIIDRTFTGEIVHLNLASKSQDRWDRNKVVFPVKVALLEKDVRLKPGMSALVDITVASKKEAVLIEHEFIEKKDDKYFVTLENGERVEIELGLQNEIVAEILKGVGEKQKIQQVDFLSGAGGNSF